VESLGLFTTLDLEALWSFRYSGGQSFIDQVARMEERGKFHHGEELHIDQS